MISEVLNGGIKVNFFGSVIQNPSLFLFNSVSVWVWSKDISVVSLTKDSNKQVSSTACTKPIRLFSEGISTVNIISFVTKP